MNIDLQPGESPKLRKPKTRHRFGGGDPVELRSTVCPFRFGETNIAPSWQNLVSR